MVQYRVVTKLNGLKQAADLLGDQMDQIKRDVMESMAADIAEASPVDSGTFVRNHQVRLRSGSFVSTKERPAGIPRYSQGDPVDKAAERQAGLQSMLADIAAVNIKSENFVFRNPMIYASIIEGRDAVYAQARRDSARIVQEAVQRAAQRSR